MDGWVPVLRTHGMLLAVRRDLAAQGLPTPSLSEPPVTTDLWFTGLRCQWGGSPNFLGSTPTGPSVRLDVRGLGRRTYVTLAGRAADPGSGKPASLVVFAAGQRVVGTVVPSPSFTFTGSVAPGERVSAYLLADDDKLHPLAGSEAGAAASLTLPDGRVLPTDPSPAGSVDSSTSVDKTVGVVEVPSGVRLADYALATVSAGPVPLGKGEYALTDLVGDDGHTITAYALPAQHPYLAVPVGSCMQWHGYDTTPLYLLQDAGPPATTVTLSGVRYD
jgi:hypothetical protein